MVRSNWIAILALGMAWASGALGQESRLQPAAPSGGGERTMTVQETGKPARKCRVLQEWRQSNGSLAYKVQAIESGEYMTIAENPSVAATESIPVPVAGSAKPMVLKTMATRIYHWGNSTTPPAGAPVPPETTAGSTPSSCNCGTSPACSCQDSMATIAARPLFPRLRQALTGRESPYLVTGEQMTLPEQTAQAKPGPAPVAPAAPKPVIQPVADRTVVNADDWRKSWGQPAEYKIQASAKVSDDKSAPTKADTSAQPPNSFTVTQDRPDPLVSPEKLAQHVEEKLAAPKASEVRPFDNLPPPPPPPESPVVSSSSVYPSNSSTFAGKMPMGAKSVLAAGSGPNSVTYLPVPVVTVPLTPPPLPPAAPAPALPVPPAGPMYTNAFTPAPGSMGGPQAPAMAQQSPMYGQSPYLAAGYTPSPYPPPVPSPYVPGQNMGQSPYYGMGQTMGSPYPGNTPATVVGQAMSSPYPGSTPPTMVGQIMSSPYPSSTSPTMVGQMMSSPYPSSTPPAMVDQMMSSPYPSSTPPAAMPQQRPPVIYQGPTPPNPFGGPSVTPVVYMAPPAPTVMVNAAMDRRVVTMAPAQPPGQDIKQLMATLRASIYPSQREVAAETLANFDEREHPEALLALLLAAREDMAPLVRATCVHCVVKMKAHGDQVATTLAALRNDTDSHVRQEVEQALLALHVAAK